MKETTGFKLIYTAPPGSELKFDQEGFVIEIHPERAPRISHDWGKTWEELKPTAHLAPT